MPWLQAAIAAPLSDAPAGMLEYAAGAAVGDGRLRLASRPVSRPVSLRLIVLGAGATVRNGTAFAG